MERGQSSNTKNKGKETVEEDGCGDDRNENPNTTISSSTDLGLALVLAPQGVDERSGAADGRRMRGGREEERTEGSNSAGRRRRMHKCKYCDKEFSTSQALGGHQNAHKTERVAAKLQESLGKIEAMGRDQMNVSGRYQPYYFNPGRNVHGGLNLGGGVNPTRQPPLFQYPHSSLLAAGQGSGSRLPPPGQVPPPVPRLGGSESASQGFSHRVQNWSEFLTRPNNAPTGEGSSNPLGGSGVGSSMGDGRKLSYFPGGIGFAPHNNCGNSPNANRNPNLYPLGNLHPSNDPYGFVHLNANPYRNVQLRSNPLGNLNPYDNANTDNNFTIVEANANVAAAAPPADDHGDADEDDGEGELDLTLRL